MDWTGQAIFRHVHGLAAEDLRSLVEHFAGRIGRALRKSRWYDSQQAGRSVHSPRSCLPGGGWQIKDLSQIEIPSIAVNGQPLRVNRALIALGADRQLVYFWFQQRGRVITNEYLVK